MSLLCCRRNKKERLCLIFKLYRAVPPRFRLSIIDRLIPPLPKCASRSWNASNLDSPLLDRYSMSLCLLSGRGIILSYMSSIDRGSDMYLALSLQFSTASFVSSVKRGICLTGSSLPPAGRLPFDAVTLYRQNQSSSFCTIVAGGRATKRSRRQPSLSRCSARR